ncbi:hypothetical protein [Streptomyces demainii]|uniref:Uncharacterized protein n=1 Tax=Streptomyces demainii TaxID=588122 RepID=A0ABT9KH98_9ACTN|nr:hypothetical protein [Streptomyces demainii]MDP9607780.1 hypothetical protein [Streptomyces demainii]
MATNDPTPAADNDRTTKTKKEHPRLASARAWWNEAWAEGGVLHERWEDVRRAPGAGWHGMANWIKAVAAITMFSITVLLLTGAVDVLLDAAHHILTAVPDVQVGNNTSTGVWATIDNPIRSYIAAHSHGLPISASTVYTVWQITGLFALTAGFATRSNGVRLTWTAWGAASIAMVWTTTPETSRTVATGIAVLAWTLASTVALRGLSLRPTVFTHIHNAGPEIRPEIHIPAPATPPADNVHPLQKR